MSYVPHRPARSESLPLRQIHVHVNCWGRPQPGSTPLVLVHGWMDVGASYQFMVDALSAEFADQRLIIAPDWRGFGDTTLAAPCDHYVLADYLGDLDALLDHYAPNGQPVDLVGHSMGGNIVMTYAGVRPERIRRLANLEGFGMPQTKPEHAPKRLRQWLDELKQPKTLRDYDSLDAVAARLMKTNPLLPADKAAWLAAHWSRRGDDGRWQILGDPAHKRVNPVLTRAEDTIATWSRISAPLLWVEGDGREFDRWYGGRYTRAQFEERLAAVPSVRKLRVSPAGHMLHHDQPEALARGLEEFLSDG